MKNHNLIEKLRAQLKTLERDILRHDQSLPTKEAKLLQALERFNPELFLLSGGKLAPCIAQISKNISHLEQQLNLNLNAAVIAYSCDKIQDQFTALKRALATTTISVTDAQQTQLSKRSKWLKKQKNQHQQTGFDWIAAGIMQNSHQLYEELNKHVNWAKKIKHKIEQLESQLNTCPATSKITLQQQILNMHQRLGKCQRAISYIEERIQLLERPQSHRY